MANLFPLDNTSTTETTTTSQRIEFKKSWEFDFEKGDFVQTPTGKVLEADGLEAYKGWCQKTLLTPRYRYLIYSRSHGQEFEDLIRRNLSQTANESEIQRMITEALMVNPRTKEVVNFVYSWDGNGSEVYVTFEAITIRDDRVELETKVVTG